MNVFVDNDSIEELSENMRPIRHYIKGYCAYKIINSTNCDYCKVYVTGDEKEIVNDRNKLLTYPSKGGLSYPSEDLVKCVAHEYVITQKMLNEKEHVSSGKLSKENFS